LCMLPLERARTESGQKPYLETKRKRVKKKKKTCMN